MKINPRRMIHLLKAATLPTAAILLVGSVLFYNSCTTKSPGKQPNVILIMTDDQGYGDMSCNGNPYIQTPNIDRLHDEGVRFTDFHVDPTCSPTRAALMTGRYSSRVGVWLTYMGRHHLRADEVTMAEVFSDNGYRTAIFGKWHLGDNYPFRPTDRGFDESLIHGGGVVGEAPDFWGNAYFDDSYLRNGEPEKFQGYCTDIWFGEALKFIKKQDEKPFFVYLPTNAPHGPLNVPGEYLEKYKGKEGVPDYRARFYGMLDCIDENIGNLYRELDAMGILDNTIIVFLTDNGTASGYATQNIKKRDGSIEVVESGYNAGMREKKGSPYEGGHRAACFIRWPDGGLEAGKDIGELSAHFDLLPSLISLCGLKSPSGVDFDGADLSPLIKGEPGDWPDRTLFVHHQGRFGQKITDDRPIKYKDYSVMKAPWRLVGEELYDISKDPGQKNNIAEQYPEQVSSMKEDYEKWWKDISSRFDEYARTIVGSSLQPETKLTCQAWHGDDVPYNHQHIRNAMRANGFWDLQIARPGVYEIELRRWPRELDLALQASLELNLDDPVKYELDSKMYSLESRAIDVTRARIKIGLIDETQKVETGQKAVIFKVPLSVGDYNLLTWLSDSKGDSWGAYYVYIRRIS